MKFNIQCFGSASLNIYNQEWNKYGFTKGSYGRFGCSNRAIIFESIDGKCSNFSTIEELNFKNLKIFILTDEMVQ